MFLLAGSTATPLYAVILLIVGAGLLLSSPLPRETNDG
jgi:hypothetical protein